MTATALRTAISADLGSLSIDKLRSVSRFVKSLNADKAEKKDTRSYTTRKTKKKTKMEEDLESLDLLCGIAHITDQDIESDERLAYILRNNR